MTKLENALDFPQASSSLPSQNQPIEKEEIEFLVDGSDNNNFISLCNHSFLPCSSTTFPCRAPEKKQAENFLNEKQENLTHPHGNIDSFFNLMAHFGI